MIELKSSTSDGSFYQVYKDNRLIGNIFKHKGLSGDRYRALIHGKGKDTAFEKIFEASHEALQWIETRQADL
jgi:hypothetical protein